MFSAINRKTQRRSSQYNGRTKSTGRSGKKNGKWSFKIQDCETIAYPQIWLNKLKTAITFSEKDYATHNFLQWYVAEQIEEEAQANTILDKINLIGEDRGGLYLFDRDIQQIAVTSSNTLNP